VLRALTVVAVLLGPAALISASVAPLRPAPAPTRGDTRVAGG
jgi:hypothetical protein